MKPIPLVDLKAQFEPIRAEIQEAIWRVVESQRFILGPEVEALETELAEYCHCRHAIGVSSGTDALLLALMALGIAPGDEVITTPYTFFATAGSIVRMGAKPVFVDIDPTTYNIDPDLVVAAITEKTKAIIPVHLFGQMAEMRTICNIAKDNGIALVEDAAQAIGADYKGAPAGSMGDIGCFSFFPSKNLGAFGDGGMVTCQDDRLAARLRRLRNHGFSPKYHSEEVGGNFRLDAIQAAVLRLKLRYLERWTEERRRRAERYRFLFEQARLSSGGAVALPLEAGTGRHVYNQFVIRVADRDRVIRSLDERQVGHETYYPVPLHLQKCFSALGYARGDFPRSEAAALETLALPIHPALEDEQQRTVVDAVGRAVELRKIDG